MDKNEQIKKFIENFFRSLKSEIKEDSGFLIVENVPESFEKFYGKKSPYTVVFNPEIKDKSLEKANDLLKAIKNFLENVGKTSLLRINFNIENNEEIAKKIKLKNCKIEKITKKSRNKFFTRFTFQTDFIYINKKDTEINHVFVYEGKIIAGDLSDYNVIEGSSKELGEINLKEDYANAKEELKKRFSKKTENVSCFLKEQFDKEMKRIQNHYDNLIKEKQDVINSNSEKIKLFEREYLISNENKIKEKIDKFNSIIIQNENEIKEINERKIFEFEKEKSKHNLEIKNKLINTTIVYYPVFCFDVFLKNSNAGRIIEVNFDPLKKEFEKFFCESCGKKIKEICLCSFGHISCEDCLKKCDSCGKDFCSKCINKNCFVCGSKVCKNCIARCFSCGKSVCLKHKKEDSTTGRTYCVNCLIKCPRCFEMKDPNYFKVSSKDGIKICDKCYIKEMGKKTIKEIFD